MPATTNDSITEADASSQGVDGGLNAKTDPQRLAPPATTRADNAWYISAGAVNQLPGFQSAMPPGFTHIYNLAAKDTLAPTLAGDTMVHGELPDPASPFTTPVWAQNNGLSPSRAQPALPHTLRTRTFAAALQRSLPMPSSSNVDRAPLMTARQEVASTIGRRVATGTYDGTTFSATFGNVDGLSDTGETLTLAITAQWVEMIGIQGTQNWALVYVSGSTLTVSIWDFYGKAVSAPVSPINNVLPIGAAASGVSQYPTMQTFNHCGVTYVATLAQLSSAQSGIVSYGVYARPLTNLTQTTFLSGPGPVQAGAPVQGFSISSPTSHQARGTQDYLAVAYDGAVWMITNPFGGGTYSSVRSGILPVLAPSGVNTTSPQGYNNTLTTLVAMPANDGLLASKPGAQVAVVVYRHLSEQVTPAGKNMGGVAYQVVAVDALSFVAGASVTISSNVFRTVGGAAICAKAFAICPSEANYAGAQAAVQGYCVVRQGAWQPYVGYNGSLGVGQYWVYDQPTYFLIDHQARIVARWGEGLAPIGRPTDLAACQQYTSSATNFAMFPLQTCLGQVLISDTLGTANDVSCLDIIIPTWTLGQQTRPLSYSIGQGVNSATVPNFAVATPLATHLSLSATGSAPPSLSGQGYSVVSGAMTCVHDGRMLTEAGFHSQTNNLLVYAYQPGDSGASSTLLGGAGFYYYVATWEWTDAQGRLQRSAPSRPAYCSSPSNGFYGALVTCPSPVSARGPVTVRLYRSALAAADKSYYLVGITTAPSIAPSSTNATAGYGTVISDALLMDVSIATSSSSSLNYLQGQPQVYTGTSSAYVGSVYPASAPPPFVWQTSSRGRAFGLAIVQGQPRIYYSSVMNTATPFEWHPLNYAPVPADVGDARSLDSVDDKILVFGSRTVGFMSGDGPAASNPVGSPSPNDGFGPVYPIPTALGVLGSGAPCRTQDGVVFQGSSGFQLIGRDLTVQAVGVLVDAITGRQINNLGTVFCRGQMLSTLQSIVWSSPQGPALVYNYITKKWSTWQLLPGATCLAQRFDGSIVVAMQPIVGVRYASRATATAPGADMGALGNTYSPIYQGLQASPGLVLETPWIYPAGESAGESALFDVAVTGTYFGPHILQVEQAYNGSATYQGQVTRFQVLTAPPVYQYRVRPIGGTRLWAVRYRISILPVTTLGSSYNLAGLSDLVIFSGSKQGTTRLLAGQSG